jgi:hypothetical protein
VDPFDAVVADLFGRGFDALRDDLGRPLPQTRKRPQIEIVKEMPKLPAAAA